MECKRTAIIKIYYEFKVKDVVLCTGLILWIMNHHKLMYDF